jgi:prevent-host-death family protein
VRTISIHDIRQDPDAFLERVETGESLLVVRDNDPVAAITPIPETKAELRPYGLCAGQFVLPADFDHALADEIVKDFEGQ